MEAEVVGMEDPNEKQKSVIEENMAQHYDSKSNTSTMTWVEQH